MAVRISENMGNPRIDNTRINIYDVFSELKFNTPPDKIAELFMLVHSREPSETEAATCREYVQQVNNRQEAFEDILWGLLNSTEFQTKR